MATKFYFTLVDEPSKIYELSCTSNVTISEDAVVSKRATEEGVNVTDHFRMDNATINYSGLISNIRNATTVVDINTFINDIRRLRKDAKLWDVYANGQLFQKCLIPQFNASTDNKIGDQAWKIDIGFQQVRYVDQAQLTTIPEPKEANKPDVQGKSSGSDNSTKEVPRALTTTIGSDGFAGIGLLNRGGG